MGLDEANNSFEKALHYSDDEDFPNPESDQGEGSTEDSKPNRGMMACRGDISVTDI